jgi:uncharacterized protein (DUF302 family)
MKMDFTATYHEFVSIRSFAEVVSAFESATGSVEHDGYRDAVRSAESREDFERVIQSHEGTSGFMRFLKVDHGVWMKKFEGSTAQSALYTLGNPLIARTMLIHDVAAGLNVPVRVHIYEASDGTVRFGYHLPSSLMSVYQNEAVMAACLKLDEKLAALASKSTGSDHIQTL